MRMFKRVAIVATMAGVAVRFTFPVTGGWLNAGRLTGTAASALDATFRTSLFKPGLELGTASTVLRF
jgi:hypothetical protein